MRPAPLDKCFHAVTLYFFCSGLSCVSHNKDHFRTENRRPVAIVGSELWTGKNPATATKTEMPEIKPKRRGCHWCGKKVASLEVHAEQSRPCAAKALEYLRLLPAASFGCRDAKAEALRRARNRLTRKQ